MGVQEPGGEKRGLDRIQELRCAWPQRNRILRFSALRFGYARSGECRLIEGGSAQ